MTWLSHEQNWKKSRNSELFVVKVIDDNNETNINMLGVDPEKDIIHINRPYMARLKYDPNWGLNLRVRKMFKLLA